MGPRDVRRGDPGRRGSACGGELGRLAHISAAAIPLLAVALLVGPARAADETQARSAELSVSVRPVRKRCFRDRIEVTGVLAARDLVDVVPEQEGARITQVLVEPLDEVAFGQVLARLARPDEPANATGSPLRAPVGGQIVRSLAVAGMPASARMGPLFRIAAGGEIDLQAEVAITDIARLSAEQAATVTPLGLSQVAGKVRRIDLGTDAATQLGRVRIGLGPGQDLRIGTFARAVIEVGESCGLAVRTSSVTYEPEGTIVHVVNGDRIEARQVVVGLLSGDEAEIRSGLGESDLVVVRAGAFVREGDRVNPIAVSEAGETRTGRAR